MTVFKQLVHHKMTAREGLEPSLHGPEPCVLPLDDRALTLVLKYTLIDAVCQSICYCSYVYLVLGFFYRCLSKVGRKSDPRPIDGRRELRFPTINVFRRDSEIAPTIIRKLRNLAIAV